MLEEIGFKVSRGCCHKKDSEIRLAVFRRRVVETGREDVKTSSVHSLVFSPSKCGAVMVLH